MSTAKKLQINYPKYRSWEEGRAAPSIVFFKHYRALATPGDGARYFAILPPT